MREFKQFPCTVYEVTYGLKIREVTVTGKHNDWSSTSAVSRYGLIRASDCHLTYTAAIRAARGKVMRQRKAINASIKSLDAKEQSLNKQELKFQQKAKKK